LNKRPTADFKDFLEMQNVEKKEKSSRESVNKEFPPCNVEWSEKNGTNVWCSNRSGGIERDWTGYPVLFKESADNDPRCACVQDSQLTDPRINVYKDCDYKASRCNRVSK